jgi:inorganic phosphate transporter, PiT family
MGLLLLVLVGFLPAHYALDIHNPDKVAVVRDSLPAVKAFHLPATERCPDAGKDIAFLDDKLRGIATFSELPKDDRWEVRQAIFRLGQCLKANNADKKLRKAFAEPIEYVPLWVVIGTALALGIGTTVGYKRIVLTVAEKIGKTHLAYAQGAAAEAVTAVTIFAADIFHAPVSTTQVLSSAVAGTMAANGSGVQGATVRRILLAWVFTLPCTMVLAGVLFGLGKWLFV